MAVVPVGGSGAARVTRIETAIIVATDLVGSTELASRVGSLRFEELRREHDSLLGDDIEDAGGHVVKNTGDGLLAAFPSVTAALAAAVAIQQHLDRRNRTAEVALAVRIGISIGDAAVDDGDYFGIPPIEATRLCGRASGGEILIADPVRAMLRDRQAHRFESAGALDLKGLPEPVLAWRVGWEPLPEPTGAALPARLRPATADVSVGRRAEQDLLLERWDQAVDGHRQVVLISGEPGIGKTHLVTLAAQTALPDQALVLYGRCDEDQGMPYHAWVEVLREYVRVAPRRLLRPHAAELSRLVPDLTGKLGNVPPPTPSDPDTERYLLFTAVGALVAAATALTPVLVILDDLHWADPPTLQLLKYLVTASATGRLMLIGTFRDSDVAQDDPLTAVLADLRRESGVTRLGLVGLDEPEIVDLIEGMAEQEIDGAGRALAGQLHRETAGNPFFVSEMLRHLRETGAIAAEPDGRWSFASPPLLRGLPQSVREVIGRRVARLGDEARQLLGVAAVIGPEFDLDLLGRAASLPAADVLDLLDEAVAASLLTRRMGAVLQQVYAFSHGLVQATLYDALPSGRRIMLHRAVGLAIETVDAGRLERVSELAHHFLEATVDADSPRAGEYARRAGLQAMSQFAYEQAEALFVRGLKVTPSDRPRDRIALLQALGEAQMRGGDADAARRTLLDAAAEARRHDEPEALARATLGCGIWGLSFGVDQVLIELAEEAITRLERSGGSRRLLAEVKGLLGAALYYAPVPENERRHGLCAEAVALARAEDERDGDRESAASLVYVLARALLADWGPDSATGDLECAELLALCRKLGHGEIETLVRNWRTNLLFERGDFAGVDDELASVEHMATELRQPRAIAFLPLHRGMQAVVRGELAEAERLNAESLRIGARVRRSGSELAATAQLLVIRLMQGRLPELEQPLRSLTAAHPGVVALRCALVAALVQAGRTEDARVEFDAVMSVGLPGIPRDNTHIVALSLLAEAAAWLGDQRRARWLYAWLRPYSGRWAVSPTAAALWPVERSLGLLAGSFGAFDAGLAHLAAARATAEPAGALPTLALTSLDEARLLALRDAPGDRARVTVRSREARLLAEELGMRHVATEAAQLETGSSDAVAAPR